MRFYSSRLLSSRHLDQLKVYSLVIIAILFVSILSATTVQAGDGYFDPPHSDYGRDTDIPLDGLYNYLTINVSFTITSGGIFIIQGKLYAPDDTLIDSNNLESLSLGPGGYIRALDFEGFEIAKNEKNGPYRVELTLRDETFTKRDNDTYYTNFYQWTWFQVSPGMLKPPHSDTGLDTNANSIFEFLAVDVRIQVNTSSATLKLIANLQDSGESQTIESKTLTQTLSIGDKIVRVNFTGYKIRQSGFSGPYHVKLYLRDMANNLLSTGTHVTSPSYVPTDFEDAPAIFVPPHNDFGLDLDSNSLFDYLIVVANVDVALAGFYTIRGELSEDAPVSPKFIAYTKNETDLPTGQHYVWLHFLGYSVKVAGVNGNYIVDLEIIDASGTTCSTTQFLTTNSYNQNNFDILPAQFPAPPPQPHSDYGLDTDSNGMYNYLVVNASISVKISLTYTLHATLWNSGRTVLINETTNVSTLSLGMQIIPLWFNGSKIYNSTFSGPYFVRMYLYDPFTNLLNMSSHDTYNYQRSSFEHTAPPDITPPTISSVTALPSPQETGSNVNISAMVTDDTSVARSTVNVTNPLGQNVGSFLMSIDAPSGRYYFDRSYIMVGTYNFQIWATDIKGNNGYSSGNFVIVDTTHPTISNILVQPRPQEVFNDINVSAIVMDNYQLQEVAIDIPGIGNFTMNYDPVESRYFHVRAYSSTGSFPFTIWAFDSSGNSISAFETIIVIDSTPPTITDLTVIPPVQQVGGSVNISARIEDNYLLDWTKIEVYDPNGTLIVNQSLTYDNIKSRYYHARSYSDVGLHTFLISTIDNGGLYCESGGDFLINQTVIDTTPPTIHSHTASPNPQNINGIVLITAIVSDDIALSLVMADVKSPTGVSLGNLTMDFDGSVYSRQGTYIELGDYTYCIWAKDTSDNGAKACGQFTMSDLVSPVILSVTTTPSPQEVHLSVNISATVNDNIEVQRVYLEVWTPSGSPIDNFTMFLDESSGLCWFTRPYSDLGMHTFTITALDLYDNVATHLGSFIIHDTTLPVADAGPDLIITLGEDVTFNASASYDNDVLDNYTWNFNDGSSPQVLYGVVATYTFTNDGTFPVTLTVRDRAGNEGTDTFDVTVNRPPQPPAIPCAPTNLGLVVVSTDSLELSWTAPTLREDGSTLLNLAGFDVFRSPLPGPPYLKINPALVMHTSYTDSGLIVGVTYYYAVKAVDAEGLESNFSAEASAKVVFTGSLSGIVVDEAQQPILDTTVLLRKGQTVLSTAITDLQGYFLLSHIEPGSFLLQLSREGYYVKEIPVEVEGGMVTDLGRIILDKIPITDSGDDGQDDQAWLIPSLALISICLAIVTVILIIKRRGKEKVRKDGEKTDIQESETVK